MASSDKARGFLLSPLLALGCGLLLLLTLAGYLGHFGQFFELTSHFRFQYLVATLALLVLTLWYGPKGWAVLSFLTLAINANEIIPLYRVAKEVTLDDSKQSLTLLLSNVLQTNSNHARLIELVSRKQPDLVIVLECDRRWVKGLKALTDRYPHQRLVPREDNFGIALYSRLPLTSVGVIELGGSGVPSISAQINLSKRELTLLATHPLPPIGERNYTLRNQQLAAIASYARYVSGPHVIIGDFNVSPWSPYFKQLLEDSGLLNARLGYGLIPSWPTFLPFMMIPIDHCLVSPDVSVVDFHSTSDIGSDHLPIFVKIRI